MVMAPLVPSATTVTETRSSSTRGSAPSALAGVDARVTPPGPVVSFTYELGMRRTHGIFRPRRLMCCGQKVHLDLIVSPPRIIPACGSTVMVDASFSGMSHSYSTLMRDRLVTSTSRAVTAPTHVGLNTNELSNPILSFGTCPCARTSNATAFSVEPLSAHVKISRCASVSLASKRNVTRVNDLGSTTPLVGKHEKGDSPSSSATSETRLDGNSNPTAVSPSLVSASVWYE